MIVVLFEVTVKKEGLGDYLSLAAGLKEELTRTPGLLRSERFTSLVNEGKILSLSIWEDERSVEAWRNNLNHRLSQRQGHDLLFDNYTITVASPIRSYTNINRAGTPGDSREFFDLASGGQDV